MHYQKVDDHVLMTYKQVDNHNALSTKWTTMMYYQQVSDHDILTTKWMTIIRSFANYAQRIRK